MNSTRKNNKRKTNRKSRLSSKNYTPPQTHYPHIIKRTPENTVAELIEVNGTVLTFRTVSGKKYKLNIKDTFQDRNNPTPFERKILSPEIFSTLAVKDGDFAFIDKSEPLCVGYPDGDRYEITYNIFLSIDDLMHLLKRVKD